MNNNSHNRSTCLNSDVGTWITLVLCLKPSPLQLCSMSDLDSDYVGVQAGGGRAMSPPPAITPTRLRTSIKATDRDGGLITKAQLRRTQQTNPPTSIEEAANVSVNDNLFLKSPKIRCASELFPRVEEDVFFNCSQTPSREIPAASC